jgi:DNA-binding NtrC family response regulator
MVGESPAIRRVRSLIQTAAPSVAPVIITGESGTGKELVARAIHELSSRCSGPFIALNCAAIPDTLIENELFGHERGAFTGANGLYLGAFEQANGGTLVLDEFAEMRLEMQVKLLRVLEEMTVRRIGSMKQVAVDVRTVAATNRPLEQAIKEGRVRDDLFYRLNVFSIELPPLRERVDDVPRLVEYFIREFSEREHKHVEGADDECLGSLMSHRWPGNIRQLRNVIERAVIVSQSRKLSLRDLPREFRHPEPPQWLKIRLGSSRAEVDRELIFQTVAFTGGNKARAAAMLGLSRRALYNLLGRYETQTPSWRPNGASQNGRNGAGNS